MEAFRGNWSNMGAEMATIIDFVRMREVFAERPERIRSDGGDPPAGEVVLFTGVRYERYESRSRPVCGADKKTLIRKPRRKKKS